MLTAVGCVSGFLFGCLNHAPWGGLIVLPVVDNRIGYFISVLLGAAVTAVIIGITKNVKHEKIEEQKEDEGKLDITFEDF